MTEALQRYKTLEIAWAVAREQAGGVISTEEEVMWTERIADVWRELSEEERELIEQLPLAGNELGFIDRNIEVGESGAERDAA